MRTLLATAVLTLALAAPAPAAVKMDPLKDCYVSDGLGTDERETINVHATGFTPLATVRLLIDGQEIDRGQADAFGAISGTAPAPFQGQGQRTFTLALVEDQNPSNLATDTALVSNLGVTLRPKRARPSRRIRFSGRGFTSDAPVFGHYVFAGKVRKTVRFARRSTLPCGTFHARRRQIPVHRPSTGDWLLQVDQQRKYAPVPASNAQRVVIRVTETFKNP